MESNGFFPDPGIQPVPDASHDAGSFADDPVDEPQLDRVRYLASRRPLTSRSPSRPCRWWHLSRGLGHVGVRRSRRAE